MFLSYTTKGFNCLCALTCSLWKNNINYEYMYMFLLKNLIRSGLKKPTIWIMYKYQIQSTHRAVIQRKQACYDSRYIFKLKCLNFYYKYINKNIRNYSNIYLQGNQPYIHMRHGTGINLICFRIRGKAPANEFDTNPNSIHSFYMEIMGKLYSLDLNQFACC